MERCFDKFCRSVYLHFYGAIFHWGHFLGFHVELRSGCFSISVFLFLNGLCFLLDIFGDRVKLHLNCFSTSVYLFCMVLVSFWILFGVSRKTMLSQNGAKKQT